jgi:hypothetical protein
MTKQKAAKGSSRAKNTRSIAQRIKEFNELLAVLSQAKTGMEEVQQRLKSKCAKKAAGRFVQQIDLTLSMVLLPYEIVMYLEGYKSGFVEAFQVVLESVVPAGQPRDGSSRPKKTEQERRAEMEEGARTAMSHFFGLEQNRKDTLVRPWLFAVVVYIWTAFECVAVDLWESALNENALPAAQRVLSSLPKDGTEDDGLSGQHVRVGLAAKYGFDLRRCMGTLLKSKFDFTSVDGIVKAYTRAFETCDALNSLEGQLKELEQTRNLIVHRGGIVDEKFLSLAKVRARRGAMLRVELPQVASYVRATILGAAGLLEMVDKRSAANPRIKPKPALEPV